MKREKYIVAEMQITEFEAEDIITTSSPETEEDELEVMYVDND